MLDATPQALVHPAAVAQTASHVAAQISFIPLDEVNPVGICHAETNPKGLTVSEAKLLNSAAVSEQACSGGYAIPSMGPFILKKASASEHSEGMALNMPAIAFGMSMQSFAMTAATRWSQRGRISLNWVV